MAKKVFFWNINGRGNSFIDKLVTQTNGCDIMLLAESKIDDNQIETKLGLKRVPSKSDFDETRLTPKLYSKIDSSILQHYSTAPSKRLCFYILKTNEYDEIIIGALHFPSKSTYNGETQLSFASNYAKWIREIEQLKNNNKTIVFGDFNMNPFEQGMIEPQAFNATLSSDIAKSGKRTSHFDKFDYFYNPMWNWLGDRVFLSGVDKLPGSYYFKTTSDVNQIYWNVFDKVIVRPELIDIIDYSTLKIIEAIPRAELINQDFENIEDSFTDHLPLVFNLKITT
ncbi:MAG: endonuclease/exonuclease/phosphatase family protein [bacterium]